ncbi:MAG: crossover junction endodeoxyribonuclease RuvC [Candidatus Portnoybacteria bacterium RBG_13_40_8]|uniref:Crossover junction endodeoxyribonuclease RuvC n=1 Tax=Candidatus Portnoybacteria bacterium RBG_13_40_8 TaxID=1801990 RepID=A0A1G2F1Y3_9BACT|nr:MAG: crossover junction endodeoxyribonuclease RuvC [Candidatus Portnoybacteria bacterium RBG_13_40_8]OGZ34820.1 MAG: crossover junction endodeoxyribonuclease RuvC [Candidatus Portnoybacteria bacterium RIFCSPHIGHO2_01_FULL_39_19]
MIILGIDPGTAITGFGVLKKIGEHELKLIDYGCIKTPSDLSTAERLALLNKELSSLLKKQKPDIAAIEDIFFFKNLKTAIKVSQARGVILFTIAQTKIPIYEYTPLQIKQAVACYGRAEKSQVQKMVKRLLNLKEIPKPDDASDALATAICCANTIRPC